MNSMWKNKAAMDVVDYDHYNDNDNNNNQNNENKRISDTIDRYH